MTTAFQANAFQNSGFQISGYLIQPLMGGPGGNDDAHWERVRRALDAEGQIKRLNEVEADRRKTEQELSAKEKQIDALEERRLKALADQAMQAELLALIMEAERLKQEQAQLMQLLAWYRIQEDDIIVILLSLPFVS